MGWFAQEFSLGWSVRQAGIQERTFELVGSQRCTHILACPKIGLEKIGKNALLPGIFRQIYPSPKD